MTFSGKIGKVDVRTFGDKRVLQIKMCKKNYTKIGQESTWTWLSISIWNPPEDLVRGAAKGVVATGSGDFEMRSYEKDGSKNHSADVRCFPADISLTGEAMPEPTPAPRVHAPPTHRNIPAGVPADDEPPF